MSRATRKAAQTATLKRREFFALVTSLAQAQLPGGMQEPEARLTMNLLKAHYGANYRVHYEVWINRENQKAEVGLHFEDGPKSTERLLEHFDRYILEIKDVLGEQVELEQWTKSWGRIYELHEIKPLDAGFAGMLAGRLAQFIMALQPILDEAYDRELVPREPRPSNFQRRFRNR